MPQFYLDQAGVATTALAGPLGFSGSHDATIKLVAAGAYQVGALNASVWDARRKEGQVDTGKVVEIFRTPTYHDYHWLGRPDLDQKFGAGFTEKIRATLLGLDGSDQRERDILALFTAGSFIPTEPGNYADIEAVARKLSCCGKLAMAVQLHGVQVRYGSRLALAGLDLAVAAGERVAVIGPSGAGKSTLIGLLNGTIPASSGSVRVLGTELAGAQPRRLRGVQRRIGTVHQLFDLVGELRVIHNVNAGRLGDWSLWRSVSSLLRPREVGAARAALDRVGLADRLTRRTSTLSGGEQQRVAIARVLLQRPALVLADEPVASVDPARGVEVMTLLRERRRAVRVGAGPDRPCRTGGRPGAPGPGVPGSPAVVGGGGAPGARPGGGRRRRHCPGPPRRPESARRVLRCRGDSPAGP